MQIEVCFIKIIHTSCFIKQLFDSRNQIIYFKRTYIILLCVLINWKNHTNASHRYFPVSKTTLCFDTFLPLNSMQAWKICILLTRIIIILIKSINIKQMWLYLLNRLKKDTWMKLTYNRGKVLKKTKLEVVPKLEHPPKPCYYKSFIILYKFETLNGFLALQAHWRWTHCHLIKCS